MTNNQFEHIAKCVCGAITVTIDGGDFSMSGDTFKTRFGNLPEDHGEYGNCNHCVNHWGIDLCACGSGNAPNECKEGFDECGTPYQSINEV